MFGGMMGQRQAIPTAEEMLESKPAKPQQSAGMCGCCRTLAMMGGQRGGQGASQVENYQRNRMPRGSRERAAGLRTSSRSPKR
jgi:hypothetical protein